MGIDWSDRAVCVVGVGACTAAGGTWPTSAASVRAGVGCVAENPNMIDKNGEPMLVARAMYLPDNLGGLDRLIGLAAPAAREALQILPTFSNAARRPLPVLLGLPAPRPGLTAQFEIEVAERLRAELSDSVLLEAARTFTSGHSAGLLALQQGWLELLSGRCDFCLVGGLDSYLEPETLEWLDDHDQLHSSTTTWGFGPGEAAGFCLLAREQAAISAGLQHMGRLLAVATAHEESINGSDSICIGLGLSEAFGTVLAALPVSTDKIDQVVCDMNGDPHRADEYGFTIARYSERFRDPSDVITPADCWGDVGAASAPLFIGLITAAALKGYSHGQNSLLWTSSENGQRGAAVMTNHTSRA